MERFVASLNSGRKLVLLSNVNQLHYEYLTAAFPSAFSLFSPDKIIPSFRVGFMKPDREIYELALSAAGVSKEEAVYVDDRQDLIEAASGYGICSIQFKDIKQLKQEFLNLGIIQDTDGHCQKKVSFFCCLLSAVCCLLFYPAARLPGLMSPSRRLNRPART